MPYIPVGKLGYVCLYVSDLWLNNHYIFLKDYFKNCASKISALIPVRPAMPAEALQGTVLV